MSINGYVFDDSPRKDLEAQMRQAQKMEALGRLAGGVAHDFNNVLMVINGLSETVLAILERASPVREDLEEILAAGRRAAGLTAQLLAFSRKRVLLPTTFDLDEAIATMQPMLLPPARRRHRARLVEPSPEPKWIVADRGQIEQVLLNLAANARDAMPEGGELRIETAIIELRATRSAATCCRAPEVVLRLADTGQGMSPDVLARLFEPYFTTKARGKGTGLGLSTVYAIVSESGGRITRREPSRRRHHFAIALPLALPPEFALAGDPHPFCAFGLDERSRRPARCWSSRTRRPCGISSTSTLQRAGYTVLSAEDATSAMARLRGHGAPIDLLLTDVIMPGRNGRELARDALELQPGAAGAVHVRLRRSHVRPRGTGRPRRRVPAEAVRARRAVRSRRAHSVARGSPGRPGAAVVSYPSRIVCLTEETTETLYLLGEGHRIVGVSGYTARPPEARLKPKVSAFINARFDKIEALEPDLILAFSDLQADIVAELTRRGYAVFTFNQRSVAGDPPDHPDCSAASSAARPRAEALAATLEAGLDAIRASAARFPRRPRVFFEEWDDPLISGIGWVDELLEMAGGEPLFPELRAAGLAKDRIVSPAEVAARDPEIVFASWCGKAVRKRTISSARAGRR